MKILKRQINSDRVTNCILTKCPWHFIVLLLLFISNTNAQQIKKFSVNAYTDPEGTAVQANCKTEGLANVIFFSKIEGIKFEGEINEQKYNVEKQKYTLCIKAGVEITIKITHRDFAPVTKVVKTNRPGEVLYFIINSDEPVIKASKETTSSKETISKGQFLLKSDPSNATIRMEGFPAFYEKTPFTFKGYTARTYKLTLEREGYKPSDITIKIDEKASGEKLVTLTPREGWITINTENSNAYDAAVVIDGINIGKMPITRYRIKIGEHRVVVEKTGLATVTRDFSVNENAETTIAITLNATKEVRVTSNVKSAEVFLNGGYIGKTPLTYNLQIGDHFFEVKKNGYIRSDRTICIRENSPDLRIVDCQLSKIRKQKIQGGPSNAFASMLLPGLGDYYVQQHSNTSRKRSYIVPLAYYLFAMSAYGSYVGYQKSYEEYHSATYQAAIDQAYQDANSKFQAFQIYASLAATAWTIDVIRVAVRGNENRKRQLKYSLNEPKTNFYFATNNNGFHVGLIHKF